MVSVFDSGWSSLGSSPGQDIVLSCVHSAPLHPGVKMATGKNNAGVTL